MRIYVLFGVRTDTFGRAYPEPIDVCDEGTETDAPEYFADRQQETRKKYGYTELVWVALQVEEGHVMDALRPHRKTLPTSVSQFTAPEEAED